uniref:Sulfotransferase n=1 Tax=Oryza meridionalis TaxID=40149 RepID=A0A0E0FB46_9ORYZ
MAVPSKPQHGATGPVPFKDVIGDAMAQRSSPEEEEYAGVVSSLPSYPKLRLRHYQGMWLMEYTLPGIMAIQRSFVPRRHGDVVLASPGKCGTTWLKALAFAVLARGAYSPTSDRHPLLRLNPHDCVPFMEGAIAEGWGGKIDDLPSPRLMSTHMQHAALPKSIADEPGCKVVYICREPKDILVSAWHFFRIIEPDLSFQEVFEAACDGKFLTGAIWDHIIGYWNACKANPEKVLFLVYEDLLRDPANIVRKLADFLGQPFSSTEEEAGLVTDIVRLCSFENLKSLEVNKMGEASFAFPNASYFRKGKAGDWKIHMTPEMVECFDTIVKEKMHGSGLVFA